MGTVVYNKSMKTCKGCGAHKPYEEYYSHPKMSDGYLNYCKECIKSRAREKRLENIDARRAHDKNRAMLPHRVAARKAYAVTEAGAASLRKAKAKYRSQNPKKYEANYKVSNAIRDGILIRGVCEVCGNTRVHAHHEDYSKPLDVVWLCPTHHRERHNEIRF